MDRRAHPPPADRCWQSGRIAVYPCIRGIRGPARPARPFPGRCLDGTRRHTDRPRRRSGKAAPDYVVADIALADWGRKEIAIAEHEMPGLMAIRKKYAAAKPLKGARIAGSLHMTIQTAVLVETLQALGPRSAGRAATSSPPRTTPPPPSPPRGPPSSPRRARPLEEYWDYTHRILSWHDGGTPNLILDDGGDATLLVHLGCDAEQDPSILDRSPGSEEEAVLLASIKRTLPDHPALLQHRRQEHRRRQRGDDHRRASPLRARQERHAALPGHQRQRLRDQEQVRQPLRLPRVADRRHQARHRRDDQRQEGGGRAATATSARAAPRPSAAPAPRVYVTEIDPICALQACMEGFQVVTMDEACKFGDIFVTATGNVDVITRQHMDQMKHNAIVCNIGHFDSEIQIAGLARPALGGDQAAGRSRRLAQRQAHHRAGQGPAGEPRLRAPAIPASSCPTRSATRRWRR